MKGSSFGHGQNGQAGGGPRGIELVDQEIIEWPGWRADGVQLRIQRLHA